MRQSLGSFNTEDVALSETINTFNSSPRYNASATPQGLPEMAISGTNEDRAHDVQGIDVGHDMQRADLAQSVMKTVVSNGNDALNILFQAAGHEQNRLQAENATDKTTPRTAVSAETSPPGSDIYKLWRSSRFVKMGWLSAEEVVAYIDL